MYNNQPYNNNYNSQSYGGNQGYNQYPPQNQGYPNQNYGYNQAYGSTQPPPSTLPIIKIPTTKAIIKCITPNRETPTKCITPHPIHTDPIIESFSILINFTCIIKGSFYLLIDYENIIIKKTKMNANMNSELISDKQLRRAVDAVFVKYDLNLDSHLTPK